MVAIGFAALSVIRAFWREIRLVVGAFDTSTRIMRRMFKQRG